MAWDLRRALLAKEEFESARLTDLEFREMVRAVKLLAGSFGIDPALVLGALTEHGLDAALARIDGARAPDGEPIAVLYHQARAEARRQLIAERGDPTPHRLG